MRAAAKRRRQRQGPLLQWIVHHQRAVDARWQRLRGVFPLQVEQDDERMARRQRFRALPQLLPRQNITVGAQVPMQAIFPNAEPGEAVIAAVADGGSLNGGKPVLPLTLDAQGRAQFAFTGSQEPGLFRVTLRRGLEVKTIELWAGPEPTYVTINQPPPPLPE